MISLIDSWKLTDYHLSWFLLSHYGFCYCLFVPPPPICVISSSLTCIINTYCSFAAFTSSINFHYCYWIINMWMCIIENCVIQFKFCSLLRYLCIFIFNHGCFLFAFREKRAQYPPQNNIQILTWNTKFIIIFSIKTPNYSMNNRELSEINNITNITVLYIALLYSCTHINCIFN